MKCHYTENILKAPLEETICLCSGGYRRDYSGGKTERRAKHGRYPPDDRGLHSGALQGTIPRGRCCSIEIKMLLEAKIPPTKENES